MVRLGSQLIGKLEDTAMKETIAINIAIDHFLVFERTIGTRKSVIRKHAKYLDLATFYFGMDKRVDTIRPSQISEYFDSDLIRKNPSGRPRAKSLVDQIKRIFIQWLAFAHMLGWIKNLPVPLCGEYDSQ
jgi:hypothetical protein